MTTRQGHVTAWRMKKSNKRIQKNSLDGKLINSPTGIPGKMRWCTLCRIIKCTVMLCIFTWCNLMWYDVMFYDVVWCDVMWYDMIWYDMIWYDMIWCNITTRDTALHCTALHFTACRGESYLDVIARIEPIIMEMERHRDPLLIVGHQGTSIRTHTLSFSLGPHTLFFSYSV